MLFKVLLHVIHFTLLCFEKLTWQPYLFFVCVCSHQKEPELVLGNEELWTFVIYAGEDHTNTQTLVAFLGLLSTLVCIMVGALFIFFFFCWLIYWTCQASTEVGAAKVYELLQGKIYRSVGWSTLFDCLSIYEDKFKKSIQSSASILPDFPEGDAQALVAYLAVLQKVWNFLRFLFLCLACIG